MTVGRHALSFSQRDFRLSFAIHCPSLRQRAQGKPVADCARGTVCKKEKTHTDRTGTAETARLSPRNGFTVYFVLSPVSGVFCHRCLRDILPQNRRHGRGARTTRLCRTLQALRPVKDHLTPQRPSQPAPRIETIAKRPSDGREMQ